MSSVASAESEVERRAAEALRRFAAVVGVDPHRAPLTAPVLVPLHLAIDSVPFAVAERAGAEPRWLLKLSLADVFDRVDHEGTVLASSQAASLGIAPKVIDESAEHGAILFEMLPKSQWRMAMRGDMDNVAIRGAVLQAKRVWHRSKRLGVTRSPFEVIAGYLESLKRLERERRAEGLPWRTPNGFHTLVENVAHLEKCFAAAGHDSVPIHGESSLSNLMIDGDGTVRLVDFDRAVNSDPHYDIAGFCLECCSFDSEVEEVVAAYLGFTSLSATARVRLYMIVDDFLWGCWSLIAHYESSRRNSVEFYKYAQNRFLRSRYWIDRWDIAALQRQI
ncbi:MULTISPECIES: phosphotransferase family protein [unclassified Burkholderia]|uniref:phosphotransferase family protein n=1 Tax=unclassified Burkholderia TaxID=2613784 RepID=UPI002AB01329|nr:MULTISPECIES: phosphotransferase [unclassified Burkholderia]